jgi:hypothetical protein
VIYTTPPQDGGHGVYDLEEGKRALIQVKGVASFAISYLPSRLEIDKPIPITIS